MSVPTQLPTGEFAKNSSCKSVLEKTRLYFQKARLHVARRKETGTEGHTLTFNCVREAMA